jgi:hypothetical protein
MLKSYGQETGRKDHVEDLRVDGRLMFKWIQGNRIGVCGLDSSGLGEGQVVGCWMHGDGRLDC